MSEEFQTQVLSALVELQQGQMKLQQGQTELQQGQTELRQGQVGLGKAQVELGKAQVELQNVQVDLQKRQVELQRSHAELQGRFADLQEGFAGQRAILDRVEGKVDKLSRDMDNVRPRMSAMELSSAQGLVMTATLHTRMDQHESRLSLVERRLELRDR